MEYAVYVNDVEHIILVSLSWFVFRSWVMDHSLLPLDDGL
jgi:hypothetical protein